MRHITVTAFGVPPCGGQIEQVDQEGYSEPGGAAPAEAPIPVGRPAGPDASAPPMLPFAPPSDGRVRLPLLHEPAPARPTEPVTGPVRLWICRGCGKTWLREPLPDEAL